MNMLTEKSLIDPQNFQKGNELYRQAAYEQAASHYIKALGRHGSFTPVYVNLALLILPSIGGHRSKRSFELRKPLG